MTKLDQATVDAIKAEISLRWGIDPSCYEIVPMDAQPRGSIALYPIGGGPVRYLKGSRAAGVRR